MLNILLGLLFLLLALAGIVLKKAYFSLPIKELKRRASKTGGKYAEIYKVVQYDNKLRGLLWVYIAITTAASLTLLAKDLPIWLGILIIGLIIYIVFSLFAAGKVTDIGRRLTVLANPLVFWLLTHLEPLLSLTTSKVEKHYSHQHTGLYEKQDILDLIKRQLDQPDNRITAEEAEILRRTLTFNERHVTDVLIPAAQVKTLSANDNVGPILINDIHESGQSYVLVRESRDKDAPVVGHLAFSSLNLKSQGKVSDIMNSTVYYLHQEDSLSEALHAFFVTNYPVFVVVNSRAEYQGIVTTRDILKELMGHVPGDDFDEYSDLGLVSTRHDEKLSLTDNQSVK